MIRKILVNGLLVLISFAVTCLTAEFFLRRFANGGTPADDPFLGKVMTPGGDWDANGFRNPVALPQSDIVAIGDSMTMGWNVASLDSWPQVLGKKTSTTAYSMALAGYGPVQYAYLTDQALRLKPEIVIYGFFFGNDIRESEYFTYKNDAWKELRAAHYVSDGRDFTISMKAVQRAADAGVRPGEFLARVQEIREWLWENSRLYSRTAKATRTLRKKMGMAQASEEREKNITTFAKAHAEQAYAYDQTPGQRTLLSPSYRLVAVDLENPATKEGWRITQDRLLAIKEKLDRAAVPFVLVFLPTKEKIYLKYMARLNQRAPESFSNYEGKEERAIGTVADFCRKNHIRYTNVEAPMVEALVRGERLFDESLDGHPQVAGYRVIADHVAKYLSDSQLLPGSGTPKP